MTNENFGEQTTNDFRYAQELAADLYEKGIMPSDATDMTEQERILVQRVTEKPSDRVLIRFLGHKNINWGRSANLDEVKMPRIVRLRLRKLFELRDKLAFSGKI